MKERNLRSVRRDAGGSQSQAKVAAAVSLNRHGVGRCLGAISLKLGPFRAALGRIPSRCRPALYFETLYNIGTGAFFSLFLLSPVVLITILDGNERHLAFLGTMFGMSSLLSPFVSYVGRRVPMRSLVLYPTLILGGFLIATAAPWGGAAWFTGTIGLATVISVCPRVAEMNMYRLLYPATHRGAAVGWLKAVASVSSLIVMLLAYGWFGLRPQWYWVIYSLVAVLMVASALSYQQIPVSRRNIFARRESVLPHHAFREGLMIFLTDRRFLLYQIAFFLAGTSNHMVMVFAPMIFKNATDASDSTIRLVVAVLPALATTLLAPVWGRFLDRINPMFGRATFNLIQCVAFSFYAYGGIQAKIWPFVVGVLLLGAAHGGGLINWLTGSLYFARSDQISLYNAIHVSLTGIRAVLCPLIGLYLISPSGLNLGPRIYIVSTLLSCLGGVMMLYQGFTDPGPRDATAQRSVLDKKGGLDQSEFTEP